MSQPQTPEELNDYFRAIFYSREYEAYIGQHITGDREPREYLEACWVLTDKFVSKFDDEAYPVVWNGERKRSEIIATMSLPEYLFTGYMLLGFATHSANPVVGKTEPLPLYKDQEFVKQVMKNAIEPVQELIDEARGGIIQSLDLTKSQDDILTDLHTKAIDAMRSPRVQNVLHPARNYNPEKRKK